MKLRRFLRAPRLRPGVIALLGAWWGLAAAQLFDPILIDQKCTPCAISINVTSTTTKANAQPAR
jgi:hypothetical protein